MNMQQLMAQAQKMQKDLLNKKGEIDKTEFVGKSDWVMIKFMGNRSVKSIDILSDEAFNKENKDILTDMIMLAIKDGLSQIESKNNEVMGSYGQLGGLF